MDTPVLLIVWRRPETLRQVIDAIRCVAPTRLFVACDGPNADRPGEADKVAMTRSVIEAEIDWPCNLECRYSDVNQGCSVGPTNAITWFLQEVEEGIILEDDCVPHPDFFAYCTNLLERYRDDSRIWCISGNNFQNGKWRGDGSYYFSRYNHCWGWATWSRCWRHYDRMLTTWPYIRNSGLLNTIFEDPVERNFWTRKWENTYLNSAHVTWWDYQWMFTCLINGGLTALPNCNLVSNIGFGIDATHTSTMTINTSVKVGLPYIQHPSFILRDSSADRYTFDFIFGGFMYRLPISFIRIPKRAFHFIITAVKSFFTNSQ